MIASVSNKRQAPAVQRAFLVMLPALTRYAARAFCHLHGDDFDNAVQEVLAGAYVSFLQLARRGETARAVPALLVRFAIARVHDGRQLGTPLSSSDVTSPHAQRKKRFFVDRLDDVVRWEGQWTEAVLEDHRTPVLDQVQFRIDFSDWLSRLSSRKRQIAETLALGYSTNEAADQCRVSAGRVSQLRHELQLSWQQFLGEAA